MKDKEVILFPIHGQDESVIRARPWVPEKKLIETVFGFSILKSDPSESPPGITQYVICLNEGNDLLRVDVYTEGFFAIRWDSNPKLTEFLESVEEYLTNFNQESVSSTECDYKLGIFAPFREPEFYDFERPLLEADLQQTDIFKEGTLDEITLLRIDTPVGDFCWTPEDGSVGFISPLKFHNLEVLKKALTRFVLRMQKQVPENVLVRLLDAICERETK